MSHRMYIRNLAPAKAFLLFVICVMLQALVTPSVRAETLGPQLPVSTGVPPIINTDLVRTTTSGYLIKADASASRAYSYRVPTDGTITKFRAQEPDSDFFKNILDPEGHPYVPKGRFVVLRNLPSTSLWTVVYLSESYNSRFGNISEHDVSAPVQAGDQIAYLNDFLSLPYAKGEQGDLFDVVERADLGGTVNFVIPRDGFKVDGWILTINADFTPSAPPNQPEPPKPLGPSAYKNACKLKITSPKLKAGKKGLNASKRSAKRLFTHGAKGEITWGKDTSGRKVKCSSVEIALLQKKGKRYNIPGTKTGIPSSDLTAERFSKVIDKLKKKKAGALRSKEQAGKRTKLSFKLFNSSSKLGRRALNNLHRSSYRGTYVLYYKATVEGVGIFRNVEVRVR